MRSEILTYEADALRMVSHFHCDDRLAGRKPGILVFPEAFGLGAHVKSRALRLAELGYAALACDLHGDGRVFKEMDDMVSALTPLLADPSHTRARAKAALDALRARPEVDPTRIAAIGYCFGGTMSLELARSGADISGVVGFHNGLTTNAPGGAHNVRCPVLVCIGADDPSVTAEHRATFEQEMRDAGVDWQIHLYGGVVHSFTNTAAATLGRPEFARYDAKADARSWAAMQAFFDEIFA